jgi:glutaminyl-tRNA synthetase
MSENEREAPVDYIRAAIAEHNKSGRFDGRVVTRFPPEPSGYLHIGHCKAICISYGVAEENGGTYYLRFDDTNPSKEEDEFVGAIQEDVRWLGFDWGDRLTFTSDYFEQLCGHAEQLIRNGKAFVCDQSQEEMREYRGTLTEPGRNSPYRDRSAEENLDLFRRMRAGEFEAGSRTLRGKIDMTASNIPMRDPVFYRIQSTRHHRTGDEWFIYPMYDFAHCLSDSIERITHSLCSIEFDNNRPLYDWILDQLELYHPQQIEFAKLKLTHTVLGKRKLRAMVEEGLVSGWDDPRLPTLRGLRRRGYTPRSIRSFVDRAGVTRRESVSELALLEYCVREDLNANSPRVMGVLRPLRVVIENYPEDQVEEFDAVNNPEDPSAGTRKVPFSRTLYVEREDFMEDPPRKFFRLGPGREVRLRYAYLVTCTDVIKDDTGEVVELRCSYDPATRGGDAPDGRKVKGTLHWVSADHAIEAEVRLYDTLFTVERPEETEDFHDVLNPGSIEVLTGCKLEPSLAEAGPGARYQFERQGYFCVDPDSAPGKLVVNRTVPLRDSWAKIQKNKAKAAS